MEIGEFRGEYWFLSNFYEHPIVVDGLEYPSVEHAFQAAKATTMDDAEMIRCAQKAGMAKELSRAIEVRSDWEEIKDDVMLSLLRIKFAVPELKRKLLATGNAVLIEGNYWNDRYWGKVNGEGLNRLGRLLMQVRKEIEEECNV